MKAIPLMVICMLYSVTGFAQLSRDLDRIMQENVQKDEPGLALRIESGGRILYNKGFGLANTDIGKPITTATNFRMASVSKQFTAMSILLLEKEGKLSLEDPLSKYFREIPATVAAKVRIRHLLTHSSGIIDYEALMPDTLTGQLSDLDVLNLIRTQDTTYFEPGTSFRYSNSAYCLMTLLAERVSASPYPKFVREQIFEPLGMKNSTIYQKGLKIEERGFGYARNEQRGIIPSDQSVTSATKGDGGVYTSLNDYSRWIQALRNNRLVNFEKIAEKLNYPIPEQINSFYGAGWFMQGKSPATFFHSGSTCGFTNFVIEIPRENFSLIYFSNIANNERPFEAILEVLARHGFPDLEKVLSLHTLTR